MKKIIGLAIAFLLSSSAFGQELIRGGGKGSPYYVLAERAGPQAAMVIEFPVGSVHDGVEYGLTRVSQYLMVENSIVGGGDFLRDRVAVPLAAAGGCGDPSERQPAAADAGLHRPSRIRAERRERRGLRDQPWDSG